MGFSAVMVGLAAVSAANSISQGYAQKAENNLNASLLEGKARVIEAQSEIEQARYDRMKGQYLSSSMANIAASGIAAEGSALAVMIETQTQIGIDQAIAKFNTTQEKNYTLAEASAQRRAGKAAVYQGYARGLSTMFEGVSNAYMRSSNPLSQKAK